MTSQDCASGGQFMRIHLIIISVWTFQARPKWSSNRLMLLFIKKKLSWKQEHKSEMNWGETILNT